MEKNWRDRYEAFWTDSFDRLAAVAEADQKAIDQQFRNAASAPPRIQVLGEGAPKHKEPTKLPSDGGSDGRQLRMRELSPTLAPGEWSE
jgi:hypothetical protein